MMLRKQLIILGIGILLLLAALPIAYLTWPARTPVAVTIDETALQRLGQLQDDTGQRVADDWQAEHWALIFFGFTHCADICPATLSHISQVLDQLGDTAEQLQPIFITLDPQRDTPEQLAAYLGFFDERILGLTGTTAQIQQVADAWGVYSRRVPLNDTYMLDHSTTLFLLEPGGELNQRFSGQMDSDSMAREIAALIND